MRRSLLALPLIVAALAGCSDVSPLAPRAVARNTVQTHPLTVTGNTIGPGGAIWHVTGGPSVCGAFTWSYWVYSASTAIWVQTNTKLHCQSSALAVWNAHLYNGGQVTVIGDHNGQVEHLATVNGDMSTEAFTADLAAGTLVTLRAYPETGCEFTHFEGAGNSGNSEWQNPQTIDPAQVSRVKAWFYCGGGGGTGGTGL